MCTTRTYTQQHAESDTLSYLARLHDAGIRGADLDHARAFALAQWDQWPDQKACVHRARNGWPNLLRMLPGRRRRPEQRRTDRRLKARRTRVGTD